MGMMEILLDTHVLIWWLFDDSRLCSIARTHISHPQNKIYVSSASAWEIATKYRIGKMPEAEELLKDYQKILQQARFVELPITTEHALKAGSLQIEHRDPFDRMLMAQAELDNLAIITYDTAFHLDHLMIIPPPKKSV
jgi:PIN domain nuclease of toxin-antitoxin system